MYILDFQNLQFFFYLFKYYMNSTLAIIGGMGPLAGVLLHKEIIINTSVKKDQDHFKIIHIF